MHDEQPEPAWSPPPAAPRRGRGAVANVVHRFERDEREAVADGWFDDDTLPPLRTTVAVEQVRTILSRNDSPDISFDRAINPYRGCEHGCVYCFARPTHAYLGWSPGLDFETRLVAKGNAAQVLRAQLAKPGYQVDIVNIGAATDAYQPIERTWKITRGLLELLLEVGHPVSLITKSALIERDLDLLAELARRRLVAVYVSLGTLDPDMARRLEPRAAAPHRRIRTIQALHDAGVPVGVSLAPVIPFINDDQMERVLAAARGAGARSAFYTMLRLPWEVRDVFIEWLNVHFPDRADRVLSRIEDLRGGRTNDPRFGSRMTGEGIWADLFRQRFRRATAALGFASDRIELDRSAFVPPAAPPRPARTPRSDAQVAPVAAVAQRSLF